MIKRTMCISLILVTLAGCDFDYLNKKFGYMQPIVIQQSSGVFGQVVSATRLSTGEECLLAEDGTLIPMRHENDYIIARQEYVVSERKHGVFSSSCQINEPFLITMEDYKYLKQISDKLEQQNREKELIKKIRQNNKDLLRDQ